MLGCDNLNLNRWLPPFERTFCLCVQEILKNFVLRSCIYIYIYIYIYTVPQMVEALGYKPKGRGFDRPWCHWNFSLT